MSKFAGQVCGGVHFVVTDRVKLPAVRVGIELALALRKLHLKEWEASKLLTLLADRIAMDGILAGEDYARLLRAWTPELKGFLAARQHFLLYP